MRKRLLILCILFLVFYCSFSQSVGIGTAKPDASAALDITTTNKGLLIPRMSTLSINAITAPAKGLMVYDSIANQLMINTGTPATPNWQPVTSTVAFAGTINSWRLNGNSGINPATQFIGNTDKKPLHFRVNDIQAGELNPANGNIFWGLHAGQGNRTGFSNVAIGSNALKFNNGGSNLVAIGDSALFFNSSVDGNTAIGSKALFTNTKGFGNTATGNQALFNNSIGVSNTATGNQTLFSNTTGSLNTANGNGALFSNTTGGSNTAVGFSSLSSNTTGAQNVAIGTQSLLRNTTGISNVGTGFLSLFSNTTGNFNIAIGSFSLSSNTTGVNNTATGNESLSANTTGENNTAVGAQSLSSNTIGFGNTALGELALAQNTGGNGQFNTAVGSNALFRTTGSAFNTAVGFSAGSGFNMGFNNTIIGAQADINQNDLFNCVALGQGARCTGSSQVRFGNSFTTSIGGIVGYTNLSDGRYKKNIQETVKGIDFIMKLRPVMYQLDIAGLNKKLNINASDKMDELSKKEINENEKTIFSGFVAQEVEQAANAVGYDFSGVDKPKNENDFYGLRYAEFVVPLVKAFQELNIKVEKLEKENELLTMNIQQVEGSEIPITIGKQQQMIIELKNQNADLQKRVLALERNK